MSKEQKIETLGRMGGSNQIFGLIAVLVIVIAFISKLISTVTEFAG